MITLRNYQEKQIDRIGNSFTSGHRHVCAVAPCGAGKTVMVAWMTEKSALKNNRILFLNNRKELIEQSSTTFSGMGIRHGIISPGYAADYSLPVQIGSVQTVSRRITDIGNFDFIIIDECHHCLADTWRRIIDSYPGAAVLGVTATPARLGGDGLGDVFDDLIIGPSVKDLIKWGNLAPYKYYAPPSKASVDDVHVKMGDYVRGELEHAVDDDVIIGDIVKNYKKLANGLQACCYCVSRKHSEHVAASFNKAGISAAYVDGDTDKSLRANTIQKFRERKIQVLCNVDLFGEGFDVPGMEAVILARPTQSLTLYIQQSMRAMRPDADNPDKVAVIIDHAGNCFRHGMPDMDREWTLESRPHKRRDMDDELKLRMCDECYQVYDASLRECPYCGYVIPVSVRSDEPNQMDGELAEIQALEIEKKEKRMEIGRARTTRDLEEIAIDRGYKMSWVWHISKIKNIRS